MSNGLGDSFFLAHPSVHPLHIGRIPLHLPVLEVRIDHPVGESFAANSDPLKDTVAGQLMHDQVRVDDACGAPRSGQGRGGGRGEVWGEGLEQFELRKPSLRIDEVHVVLLLFRE